MNARCVCAWRLGLGNHDIDNALDQLEMILIEKLRRRIFGRGHRGPAHERAEVRGGDCAAKKRCRALQCFPPCYRGTSFTLTFHAANYSLGLSSPRILELSPDNRNDVVSSIEDIFAFTDRTAHVVSHETEFIVNAPIGQ